MYQAAFWSKNGTLELKKKIPRPLESPRSEKDSKVKFKRHWNLRDRFLCVVSTIQQQQNSGSFQALGLLEIILNKLLGSYICASSRIFDKNVTL